VAELQGAILMRGYLERCNQPKIKNFIAWVSPQMGVYGVPNVRRPPISLPVIAVCSHHSPPGECRKLVVTLTRGVQYGSWKYLNVTLDDIADCCIYDDWAQELFSFAGYWRGTVAPVTTEPAASRALAQLRREAPS
jgi:hypothetical protein